MSSHVFIVGAPRAGAGLVHACLTQDSSWVKSSLSEKGISGSSFASSEQELTAEQTAQHEQGIRQQLRSAFADNNASGSVLVDYHHSFGMNVSALAAEFPDAKFIHVLRGPAPAASSGVRAWTSGKFVTYPDLPGWWGEKWSFGLVPNWKDLIGKPLPEVVVAQYLTISNQIIDDLAQLPEQRVSRLSYEALLKDPAGELARVTTELGLGWSATLGEQLPLSVNSFSKPVKDAWKKNVGEIVVALRASGQNLEKLQEVLRLVLPEPLAEGASENPQAAQVKSIPSAGTRFSSTHSKSLLELLQNAGISLLITTYKSGHAIIVRPDYTAINTTFKGFKRPMGIAVAGSRLAIGTADSIESFVNQPGLSKVVEPKGDYDRVYAPRATVNTGDVSIHEMAYGFKDGVDNLWFVNTKFSCLCRQDLNYSFVPVWRPKWITAYAAEDRCHLNGLAMVDGAPKYVTALSQTDTVNGWREHKGTSGVIIDVTNDRIVASGLSMPHSPRWHQGKLWVLESGKGTLATVDPETGEVTTVATLPGFTRGLTFFRSYAFIGLSQVRESVFKSLPVTEQTKERNCGVWVVDIRSGNTVAFLKFSGVVQELFDVAIIPNSTWPIIIDSDEKTINSFVLDTETLKNVSQGPAKVEPVSDKS
jgi:uncharacterized protein (TIGR03032 family)